MINLELFSKRVKECRESMGLTLRELAEAVGTSAANISRYETGKHGAGPDIVGEMATVFNVNPVWLMGAQADKYLDNIKPCKRIPVVGTIAAGLPILAEECIEGYEWVEEKEHVDFCLKVKGNSMIGARIYDGDLVFIRLQPEVESGEIAAVLVDGQDATLKRVFLAHNNFILHAENPEFKDLVFSKKESREVVIIGKAISFKSEVR